MRLFDAETVVIDGLLPLLCRGAGEEAATAQADDVEASVPGLPADGRGRASVEVVAPEGDAACARRGVAFNALFGGPGLGGGGMDAQAFHSGVSQ